MSPLSVVLPAVLLLAGIVSLLGARGGLPRNRWFGVRVPAAMGNDDAWIAAHRAAILPSWVGFMASASVGATFWFAPALTVALNYLMAVAFIVSVVALLVLANRAARALAVHAAR